jgi:hypothetical protein
MNKKVLQFNLILIPLAILSGWSLSKATLIGKVGIHILHKELTFLNSWWKGAIFIWIAWIVLELIQFLIWKRASRKMNLIIQSLLLLLALIGLYYTYLDFRTFSHRLLGERFHIGGYLFWIVWIFISAFFVSLKKDKDNPELAEV